jgi:hypothetical protein
MNILAAIKREEKKLEKQMSKLQHQLNGIRSAAQALGHSAAVEVKVAKKRVLSAAGRAAISRAAKKRWATVRSRRRNLSANRLARPAPESDASVIPIYQAAKAMKDMVFASKLVANCAIR